MDKPLHKDWNQYLIQFCDETHRILFTIASLLLVSLFVRQRRRWGFTRVEVERAGRPFSEMPGPQPWPLVGTLPYYWTGEYSWDRLHRTGAKKYKEFGDCVREAILPGLKTQILWSMLILEFQVSLLFGCSTPGM